MTDSEHEAIVAEALREVRKSKAIDYRIGERVRMTAAGRRIWPHVPQEGTVTDVRLPPRRGQWSQIAVHGKYWHGAWWTPV